MTSHIKIEGIKCSLCLSHGSELTLKKFEENFSVRIETVKAKSEKHLLKKKKKLIKSQVAVATDAWILSM